MQFHMPKMKLIFVFEHKELHLLIFELNKQLNIIIHKFKESEQKLKLNGTLSEHDMNIIKLLKQSDKHIPFITTKCQNFKTLNHTKRLLFNFIIKTATGYLA